MARFNFEQCLQHMSKILGKRPNLLEHKTEDMHCALLPQPSFQRAYASLCLIVDGGEIKAGMMTTGWINRVGEFEESGEKLRHEEEEANVRLEGKGRMEGQVKEVFRGWMSRQPYANLAECVQKLSVFLSPACDMMGVLHSCMMSLADGKQI